MSVTLLSFVAVVGNGIDVPSTAEHLVIYSQESEQQCLPGLTTTHCNEKHLCPGLEAA